MEYIRFRIIHFQDNFRVNWGWLAGKVASQWETIQKERISFRISTSCRRV